jgi:hypothetical protein
LGDLSVEQKLDFPSRSLVRSQVSWYMPEIPALGRRRQENGGFKGGLDYTVKPCLKKK